MTKLLATVALSALTLVALPLSQAHPNVRHTPIHHSLNHQAQRHRRRLAHLKMPNYGFTPGAGDRAYEGRDFSSGDNLKLSTNYQLGRHGPVASVGYLRVAGPAQPGQTTPADNTHALVGGAVTYPFK